MARKSYFRSQAHPLRNDAAAGRLVAEATLGALIIFGLIVVALSAFVGAAA